MNKLEARYAQYLEKRKIAGEVVDYWYEPMRLRLAKATFYTPDFLVIGSGYEVELHEVKGYWTGRHQHSRVKFKVAAQLYPFRFVGVQERPKREGGGWVFEEAA